MRHEAGIDPVPRRHQNRHEALWMQRPQGIEPAPEFTQHQFQRPLDPQFPFLLVRHRIVGVRPAMDGDGNAALIRQPFRKRRPRSGRNDGKGRRNAETAGQDQKPLQRRCRNDRVVIPQPEVCDPPGLSPLRQRLKKGIENSHQRAPFT